MYKAIYIMALKEEDAEKKIRPCILMFLLRRV